MVVLLDVGALKEICEPIIHSPLRSKRVRHYARTSQKDTQHTPNPRPSPEDDEFEDDLDEMETEDVDEEAETDAVGR